MTDEFEEQPYNRTRDPIYPRRRSRSESMLNDGGVSGADLSEVADPIDETAVDIFYLLDSLEELVSIGKRFPFSGKVMVDENEFLALVDQLRIAVPNEIKQAQRVIRERQTIIEEAHNEAVRISDSARKSAEYFVSQEGVLSAARLKGEQILKSAERERNSARGQIDAYALEQFDKVEQAMRDGMTLIAETLEDAQLMLRDARGAVGQ
jgi:hypothetical protein